MIKGIQNRKLELYNKSIRLRNINTSKLSFKKAREIHKEQDDAYKKLQFITNLEKATRRING